MKKIISLLCVLLLLGLCACGKEKAAPTAAKPQATTPSEEVSAMDVLLAAMAKLQAEKSFAITVDSTTEYGDATNLNTEQLQTVGKFQKAESGYVALITNSENFGVYMCGAEIYRTQQTTPESKDQDHTIQVVLDEFYRYTGFHSLTLEDFAAKEPQRTNNADGSITFTLPEVSVQDYSWLVSGKEMSEQEAAQYVSKGISISFTVDAKGYLSGAEVNFAWATPEGDQQSRMHAVYTVSQIGEDLNIQAPDWTTG